MCPTSATRSSLVAFLFCGLLAAPAMAVEQAAHGEAANVPATEETAATHDLQHEAATTEKTDEKRSGRLRFRSGHLCLCATGLTENDIQQSQRRTAEKLEKIAPKNRQP